MKSNIYQELDNIMNKLATNTKTGIFLGAGSSMSAGMQGIDTLTKIIIKETVFKDQISNIVQMEKIEKRWKLQY